MCHNDIGQHDWAAQQNWLEVTNTQLPHRILFIILHSPGLTWALVKGSESGLTCFIFNLFYGFIWVLLLCCLCCRLEWIMCFPFDSVALQPCCSITFCTQDKSFSWKNRLEELSLSCKTRFCVSVSVCTEFSQACVCWNVHICSHVSLFHLLAACMLCKSVIAVSAVDARMASCVVLCVRVVCIWNSSSIQATLVNKTDWLLRA